MKGLLFLTFIVASVFAQDHLLLPGETLCPTHQKCPPTSICIGFGCSNNPSPADCHTITCTKDRLVNGPFTLGFVIGYSHGLGVFTKVYESHHYLGCMGTTVEYVSLSKDGTLIVQGDNYVFGGPRNVTYVELTRDGEVVLGGVEGGKVEGCLYKGN